MNKRVTAADLPECSRIRVDLYVYFVIIEF